MGASLQKKYAAWRDPKLTLKDINVVKGDVPTVVANYSMLEGKAELSVSYMIYGDGTMDVTQAMTAIDKKTCRRCSVSECCCNCPTLWIAASITVEVR